jgi:hypothetical protein
MGWTYFLVNHSQKIIEEVSLQFIWQFMRSLRARGWKEDDSVEMMYEESSLDTISNLVGEGYTSPYDWSLTRIK